MNIVNVSDPIVRHYLILVEANKKTIQEVPEKFRQEVADILNISLEEHKNLTDTVTTLESVIAVLLGEEV